MPYETIVAGNTITATWANASVRDQVVTPFATAAARDSAITAPVDGMLCYITGEDSFYGYDGTAWREVFGGPTWITVVKTADESVSGSASVQNDDHLSFTTVSGASYEIELILTYASPAGAGTPDFKFDLGEDSTARGVFFVVGLDTSDGANSAVIASNQTATAAFGTSATKRVATAHGHHQGAGGTFRLRWAQNTSNGNATILYTDSLLRYRRIV